MIDNPPPRPVQSGCLFSVLILLACCIAGWIAWDLSSGNQWISSGTMLVVGFSLLTWAHWSNK